MNEQEKQKIEASLKIAYDNTIKEQDFYGDRITVMEEVGNKDYLKKLPSTGWDGIAEAMANECWPADYEDREKYLGQNWEEVPSRILIDQIEDKDIRCSTYFLGEVVEQCHRIKAIAKFFEFLGANPDDPFAGMLFGFWVKYSVLFQLATEQLEAGGQKKAESLREVAEATAEVVGLFCEDPEISEKIPAKEIPDSLIELPRQIKEGN